MENKIVLLFFLLSGTILYSQNNHHFLDCADLERGILLSKKSDDTITVKGELFAIKSINGNILLTSSKMLYKRIEDSSCVVYIKYNLVENDTIISKVVGVSSTNDLRICVFPELDSPSNYEIFLSGTDLVCYGNLPDSKYPLCLKISSFNMNIGFLKLAPNSSYSIQYFKDAKSWTNSITLKSKADEINLFVRKVFNSANLDW